MKKMQFWLPRGIMILYILFISLFALDAFDPELGRMEQILGFLIHMIPSFILIAILIVSWRRPLYGAIGYISASILFTVLVHGPSGGSAFYILVTPSLLGALLFFLEYRKGRKSEKKESSDENTV